MLIFKQISTLIPTNDEIIRKVIEDQRKSDKEQKLLLRASAFKQSKVIEMPYGAHYGEIDLLMAQMISQAYAKPDARQLIFTYKNETFHYRQDKSNGLYAHYEGDVNIFVAIHGADDLALNLTALRFALDINAQDDIINAFCDKYDELAKSNKNVILGGHSIGGFAINKCMERNAVKLQAITYGAFHPKQESDWGARKVRKHLYTNDWLSNNILNHSQQYDTHLYQPNGLAILNGHALGLYLDQDKMNRNMITQR